MRRLLTAGLGFSKADRDENVRRIGWVAAEVARHGGLAICCPIAPYAEARATARALARAAGAGFVLVYVATPLEVCEQRDRKGLYAKARAGQLTGMTGVDDPYEVPTDADLVHRHLRPVDRRRRRRGARAPRRRGLARPPLSRRGVIAPFVRLCLSGRSAVSFPTWAKRRDREGSVARDALRHARFASPFPVGSAGRPSAWSSPPATVPTCCAGPWARSWPRTTAGRLRVAVVFDGAPPDHRLARDGCRPVDVRRNHAHAGAGGARNTGILAVARLRPGRPLQRRRHLARDKLTRQVLALRYRTAALFATCAAEVEYDGRYTPHLARAPELDVQTAQPRPHPGAATVGFVAHRDALVTEYADGRVGLLAEDAPADGEDWDLLMRRRGGRPSRTWTSRWYGCCGGPATPTWTSARTGSGRSVG